MADPVLPDRPDDELMAAVRRVSEQQAALMYTAWAEGLRDGLTAAGSSLGALADELNPGPFAEVLRDLADRLQIAAHNVAGPGGPGG